MNQLEDYGLGSAAGHFPFLPGNGMIPLSDFGDLTRRVGVTLRRSRLRWNSETEPASGFSLGKEACFMFVDSSARNWAADFGEIPAALLLRPDLSERMIGLLDQPMPGKVTEGRDRIDRFRSIMAKLISGDLSLFQSYQETEIHLPQRQSPYAANSRVFPAGWAERQVRTQFSRLYNQSVLEQLMAERAETCFIPHSSAEAPDTKCTVHLAGKEHEVATIYRLLVSSYTDGNWTTDVKVPDHPHCTHVVTPQQS